MTWKDANETPCRIKDDGTTPWSPNRSATPNNKGGTDREIEEGRDFNALVDMRTTKTYRMPKARVRRGR